MPFTIKKTPPNLTPGSYPAKITDVKAVAGQYGPQLTWSAQITQDGTPYSARAFTDSNFYEGSREYQWATAILGPLNTDDEISENELIGAPVIVRISCKPGRNGLMFYNIEDLMTPKGGETREHGTPEPGAPNDEADVPF